MENIGQIIKIIVLSHMQISGLAATFLSAEKYMASRNVVHLGAVRVFFSRNIHCIITPVPIVDTYAFE